MDNNELKHNENSNNNKNNSKIGYFTEKNIIVLLVGIIVGFIIVGCGILFYNVNFSNNKNKTNEAPNVTNTIPSNGIDNDSNNEINNSSNNQNEVNTDINSSTPTITPSVTSNPVTSAPVQTSEPVASSEDDVISYFSLQNDSIVTTDESNSSFRESAKNAFVTIVDFIFYDGTIKGYKFKDLTTGAKLQVIKIALVIDNKIDHYFPNYKDGIKAAYGDLKAKIVELYLEYSAKACEKVGSVTCNQAREDFKNMKESFGFTFDLLKGLGTNAVKAIAEWYQIFKTE